MKYNAELNRWISKEGLIFRYDENNDRLVLCKLTKQKKGKYLVYSYWNNSKKCQKYVHRIIWETFNDIIPEGKCIDHINTDKEDNRLSNLRVVTHKENTNNPLTLSRLQKVLIERNKDRSNFKVARSEFGFKFYEKYNKRHGDDRKLYEREYCWYKSHGHCRWEEE